MKNDNTTTTNDVSRSRFKINWGTAIVIAIALFMSFILYFVIKVQTNSKYDNELVVEEYYKHDSHFQDEMKRVQNAHDLKNKPTFTESTKGITVAFPAEFEQAKIKGKVSLYRPSNKKFDFEIPISFSESNPTLLIPKLKLVDGRWDIIMEWQYDGKLYLSKETLYL
ncbi:FixH family protein [Flavobacterium sp. 7A]|uniref:FixH family protein n=1 Tax=Flavobacterium sp. 7A TaxID=2940571 RepID=UPI0022263307|nr:FixH family protein [Flavobacterium sp. 7A]MCW2119545.1 nitrogen fixation protein FixH [Flavobacterium sp. 7A]